MYGYDRIEASLSAPLAENGWRLKFREAEDESVDPDIAIVDGEGRNTTVSIQVADGGATLLVNEYGYTRKDLGDGWTLAQMEWVRTLGMAPTHDVARVTDLVLSALRGTKYAIDPTSGIQDRILVNGCVPEIIEAARQVEGADIAPFRSGNREGVVVERAGVSVSAFVENWVFQVQREDEIVSLGFPEFKDRVETVRAAIEKQLGVSSTPRI